MTDLMQEYSETAVGLLSHIGMDNVRALAKRLNRQADEALARGGFAANDRKFEWAASLRYFGQEHTLDTPLEEGRRYRQPLPAASMPCTSSATAMP